LYSGGCGWVGCGLVLWREGGEGIPVLEALEVGGGGGGGGSEL